jgi:signal transduction histidine kinase
MKFHCPLPNVAIALVFIFLIAVPCQPQNAPAINSDPVELLHGWQYRWGDSPLDSDGVPLWTRDIPDDSAWKNIDRPLDPPDRNGREFLWLRIRLPEHLWNDPAIFLSNVLLAAEVYLDTRKIYATDPLGFGTVGLYAQTRWHIFPLDEPTGNKILLFRIHSDDPNHIGLPIMADNKVFIGSRSNLVGYVVRNSIDRFVLGCLFILIGQLSIDLFFHRWKQKTYYYLSFGGFAICVGLACAASGEVTQFVISSPAFRFHATTLGLLFFPVGFFSFYEQIADIGRSKLLRRLWQSFLIYGVFVLVLQLAEVTRALFILYIIWALLLVVGLGAIFLLAVRGAIRGSAQMKIFNAGFLAVILFVGHDIIFAFGLLPYWHWLSPWGILLFILCLSHIIEMKNAEDQKRLEEYSQNLEQQVDDRTCDLREKNSQLEEAMQQLRQTQEQLVLREKMASLGKLIAGVAHEINNPIGAVRSAADVSARAVEKIAAGIGEEGGRLQNALQILRDNSRAILSGSERIARIVRSLRAFAHLDEAPFQNDIDAREEIDSAITLLEDRLPEGVEIIRDYADIPRISCYPAELNTAFMDLLENGTEAIEGSGTITVTVRSDDTGLHIRFADTGRGISPDDMDEIFDPGFTTKGSGVGTGLGLSTALGIVQKHGGEITVESRAGEGTTFAIRLPLKTTDEQRR